MLLRKITALLVCLFVLLALCGCSADRKNKTSSLPENGDPAEESGDTVTDASGVVLSIPESGDIKIASAYAVAVPFIVALGLSDNVVAINYKSRFWADNIEPLSAAGSVGRGIVDLELLAEFSPDLLIHRANDAKTTAAVTELGIPVLGIHVENIDEIMSTLDLLGNYCHAQNRAREVKEWMNGKFGKIADLIKDIPESGRPRAVVMGGEPGIIAGGEMLQSLMLTLAGAASLSEELTDSGYTGDNSILTEWINIGVERIFDMNPDVIFCTGSTVLDYSAGELLSSPVWSEVGAVKNNMVLQIPAKLDSWDLPGISCALGTMWMLHKLYPELLSADELQAEIDEYYMFMFGRTFDSEYLGYDLSQKPVIHEVKAASAAEFSVDVNGIIITSDDMKDYPVYSVQATSVNTYGTVTTREYIGYAVSDLLKAAGLGWDFVKLTAVADDGYTVTADNKTALEPSTLIAVTENGKSFIEGPWFAPCSSGFSPDYLRDLSVIILE